MNLPPSIVPKSKAMIWLTVGARKKIAKKMFWDPQSRILWAMQDTRQSLFLTKVTDLLALEILPSYDAEIEHTASEIFSLTRSDEARAIKQKFEEFSKATGEVLQTYDCNGEFVQAFSRDVREMTEGKISIKSLRFLTDLPCDTLHIKSNGIHLIKNGDWQAFIIYRKLLHFRPCTKPLPPSVLTPRSPEIP